MLTICPKYHVLVGFVLVFLVGIMSGFYSAPAISDDSAAEFIEFDDQPLAQDLVLPDWFKLSFLELQTDLDEARDAGKWGVLLYFGSKDCPYCKVHLKKNWKDRRFMERWQSH